MTQLYAVLFLFAVVALAIWLSVRSGKATAEKDQAEDNAHDMEEDAAIAAMPYIDNPVGSMRPPKK